MNMEFHYQATGIIAQRTGFTDEEAKVIAYCSEYVNETDICWKTGIVFQKMIFRQIISVR